MGVGTLHSVVDFCFVLNFKISYNVCHKINSMTTLLSSVSSFHPSTLCMDRCERPIRRYELSRKEGPTFRLSPVYPAFQVHRLDDET